MSGKWQGEKITKAHILEAAEYWEKHPGALGFGPSRKYDIYIDGKPFPPKAISALAYELATKKTLEPKDFPGAFGGYWHEILKKFFPIWPKTEFELAFPQQPSKDDLAEQEILKSDRHPTEIEQLISARRGQGLYRQRVMMQEKCCRVTDVDDARFLIASHIKPWRDSDDRERLDGENGLLLAPHIDKLFDRGWISFEDNGALLVSKEAAAVIDAWNIKTTLNVGLFTTKHCEYLKYHRERIFEALK